MPEDTKTPTSKPKTTDKATEKSKVATESALSASGSDVELIPNIIEKINEAQNILVALSSDPSVDEMAAAIGLSIFLDKLGKRATSIYSGATPNALEFLKPEKTFEPTIDALQDFVIALDKDKADHLRYKLDGDFVKIYITPYKTRISEKDLEYSYGDFNVDLVIAIDVANGIDLDEALREHGRIMHDAVIINITNGNPGKLGEIEWSDKDASSVSEMLVKLIQAMDDKAKMDKEEATAFLTGIVSATNRFSNDKTTPGSMVAASKLMEFGANQQLISKNITLGTENIASEPKVDNTANDKEDATPAPSSQDNKIVEEKATDEQIATSGQKEKDATQLEIDHNDDETPSEPNQTTEPETVAAPPEPTTEPNPTAQPEEKSEGSDTDLMDDLKAAEANLTGNNPSERSEADNLPLDTHNEENSASDSETVGPIDDMPEKTGENDSFVSDKPEKVLQPPSGYSPEDFNEVDNKYGKMLEDALTSIDSTPSSAPSSSLPPSQIAESPDTANPATANAPTVPANPEINGVPQINYLPLPGDETLPPPPPPPIDIALPPSDSSASPAPNPTPAPTPDTKPIAPATPPTEPTPTSLGSQPAMQDQVYGAQAADPSAFKIPGM